MCFTINGQLEGRTLFCFAVPSAWGALSELTAARHEVGGNSAPVILQNLEHLQG